MKTYFFFLFLLSYGFVLKCAQPGNSGALPEARVRRRGPVGLQMRVCTCQGARECRHCIARDVAYDREAPILAQEGPEWLGLAEDMIGAAAQCDCEKECCNLCVCMCGFLACMYAMSGLGS